MCVSGNFKIVVLVLLKLQVLYSWDTTQSVPDGGVGDELPALDLSFF